MKTFLKVFTVSFLTFMVIFSSLVWSYNHYFRDEGEENETPIEAVIDPNEENDVNLDELDELQRLVYQSNRVNFVVMGLEGTRTDTLMFVSFDKDTKKTYVMSIPRDTYYHRKGYDSLQKRKINAVYGDHGVRGVKTVVSDLLHDIPVDYYVTVTYKGVAAIVDSMGGVPVNIPHLMNYSDPYDKPPLKIYFEPGYQVLNGEDSVKFLRYRKASPGTGAYSYAEGDIGRIKAQQEFIKSALKKALSLKLPAVVSTAAKHVKTDIEITELVSLATSAMGMSLSDVEMTMLPGEDRYQDNVSFYFPDSVKIKEKLIEIYGGEVPVEEQEATSTPQQ